MGRHLFFAASSAHRWLQCGASAVVDTSRLKQRRSSPAAERGTLLHSVAEALLVGSPVPAQLEGEDLEAVMAYVSYVRSKAGHKLLELPVVFVPDCGGTADCVIVHHSGLLEVVDFKSGFHPVDPIQNVQMAIYALGAIRELDSVLEDVAEIRLTIVQPKCGEPRSWDVSRKRLESLGGRISAKVEGIKDGNAEFCPSEEACHWCPAKAICPALQARAAEVAREDFKPEVPEGGEAAEALGKHLAEQLELVPTLKGWISSVEDEAKALLLAGSPVPGWKVVEGRRPRNWTSELEAKAKLLFHLSEDQLYGPAPFVSPAQAEKLLKAAGADKKLVDPLVTKAEGPPTMARESDKRPAIRPGDQAKRDFAEEASSDVREV